jgi:hypothetical protein
MPSYESPQAVRQAIHDLDTAHRALVSAIEAIDEPDAALAASAEASERFLKMRGEIADLRTRIVGEIWERERLSLAGLADRIAVSKTRADEIIRTYKKQRADKEESPKEHE